MTLVLFDVDGTLVDAGGAGRWALDRAFEDVFGLRGVDSRAAGVRFEGRTDPLIIEEMASRAGVSAGTLAGRRGDLEEAYVGRLERRLDGGAARALPGVAALLRGLAERSIPFGLLTGNVERGARLKLRAAGLDGVFEAGAFGNDGHDRSALGRIARERFEALLGRSIDPSEVVIVGDSVEDVRAARANGYRCLAVNTGWVGEAALEAERPDRLVQDLGDTESVLEFLDRTAT